MVGVPVRGVDAVEALRELDERGVLAVAWVEHEAHAGAESLRVVDVVVAVEVDEERRVGEHGGCPEHRVHGAGFLLVVIAMALLAGQVDEHGEACVDVAEVEWTVSACW